MRFSVMFRLILRRALQNFRRLKFQSPWMPDGILSTNFKLMEAMWGQVQMLPRMQKIKLSFFA